MELAYSRSLWPLAFQPRASLPTTWGCVLVECPLWRFGGGVMLAPGLSLDLETFTPLWNTVYLAFCKINYSQILFLLSSSAPAICSPTLKLRKEKKNLCDPWKISLQTKPAPTPPCFVPLTIFRLVFFGLSSAGFSQDWNCPDSQQSCWVAMPQSECEICYSSFSWVQFSHSVMSYSLRLHRLQHTRFPCPSATPGLLKLMSFESVMPSNHPPTVP